MYVKPMGYYDSKEGTKQDVKVQITFAASLGGSTGANSLEFPEHVGQGCITYQTFASLSGYHLHGYRIPEKKQR